jgi:predicted transcriptional regulator
MTDEQQTDHGQIVTLTAEIMSAYLGNNVVAISDLPNVISSVAASIRQLDEKPVEKEELVPAVPIKKSVTPDYLVCLEDGKKLKMLKQHLKTQYDMTPEDYRKRWGLKDDYPMVAPAYAATRSALAKKIGLGRPKTAKKTRARRTKAS